MTVHFHMNTEMKNMGGKPWIKVMIKNNLTVPAFNIKVNTRVECHKTVEG